MIVRMLSLTSALAWAAVIAPIALVAQEPAPADTLRADTLVSEADVPPRVMTLTEPGTAVIATEVLVMAGLAAEPSGSSGLAHLAGRSIVLPLEPALDSLGSRVSVTPGKDALGFTLIAAPDAWEESVRMLMHALFRDGVDDGDVIAARRQILAELGARENNPADVARQHVEEAVFGSDHPWSRATSGYVHSVRDLGPRDVDAFLRAHFTPERSAVAVVGPIRDERVQDVLSEMFGRDEPLLRPEIPPAEPIESPLEIDYNTITTWVSASYLAPASLDPEAVRFLAAVLSEDFSFDPRRRSVYNSHSEVHLRQLGTEVRLQLVVPPQEARDWARRVQERVATLASSPMDQHDLQARLRRFRGERLRALGMPEARAAEAARALLVGAPLPRWTEAETDLTAARLQAVAAALSDATVVLVGPFQAIDGE
jgi:predicted Zn-dependent peptidase